MVITVVLSLLELILILLHFQFAVLAFQNSSFKLVKTYQDSFYTFALPLGDTIHLYGSRIRTYDTKFPSEKYCCNYLFNGRSDTI